MSDRAQTSTERLGEPWLLYDGECPFCARYVQLTRLRETVGALRIINARDGGPELAEAQAASLVIDDGMVLKLDGQLYHGDACLNRLALLSSRSTLFNRFAYWSFRSPTVARVSYPALKLGRSLALRLLGRERMGY
ncbi:MAG: DCC1-like thiol-disulfide oxidoreductase family protein [Pseudomonadota bacterium]